MKKGLYEAQRKRVNLEELFGNLLAEQRSVIGQLGLHVSLESVSPGDGSSELPVAFGESLLCYSILQISSRMPWMLRTGMNP